MKFQLRKSDRSQYQKVTATVNQAVSQTLQDAARIIETGLGTYRTDLTAYADEGAVDGRRGVSANNGSPSIAEMQIDQRAQDFLEHLNQTEVVQKGTLATVKEQVSHWNKTVLDESSLGAGEPRQHQVDTTEKWARLPSWKIRWNIKQLQLGGAIGLIDWLTNRLGHINSDLQDAKDNEVSFLVAIGKVRPIMWIINRPFLFYGFLFFLFLVECVANYGAFQLMDIGGHHFGALVIGSFFALAQAIGAKIAGQALWERHWWKLGISSVFTLIVCGLLCLTRWQVADGLANQLIGVFINSLIAVATFYAAYGHQKFANYFAVKAIIRRLEVKALHIARWIANIHEQRDHHLKTLRQQLETDHEHTTRALHDARFAVQQRLEQGATALTQMFDAARNQVEHIRESAHYTYQKLKQLTQEKSDILCTDDGDAPSAARPPNGSSHVKHIVTICLLMSLSLFGCQHEQHEPVHDITIEILYDQTDKTGHPDTVGMTNTVLDFIDDQFDAGHWGHITINLSQIGDVSSQKVWTVTLDASPPFWFRSEKKLQAELLQFKTALVQAIAEVAHASEAMEESHIHQNFYHRLDWLQQQEGVKWVISWSDLILNDGAINFYQYQLAPELLLQEKKTLWQQLEAHYPLGDLTGIHLVNYHLPTRQDDDLHAVAKQFFGEYWHEHGMEVEFHTNHHPTTHLILSQQ